MAEARTEGEVDDEVGRRTDDDKHVEDVLENDHDVRTSWTDASIGIHDVAHDLFRDTRLHFHIDRK